MLYGSNTPLPKTEAELVLPAKPTLKDYQLYVHQLVHLRGFEKENLSGIFMLLVEEVGELAKAARKHAKLKMDVNHSKQENAAHEAADIFMYLLDICNHLDIDLEKAIREKEEINRKRVWK